NLRGVASKAECAQRTRTVRGVINPRVVGPARPQRATLADVTDLDPEIHVAMAGVRAGGNHAVIGVEQPRRPVSDGKRADRSRVLVRCCGTALVSSVKVGVLQAICAIERDIDIVLNDLLWGEVRRVEGCLPILVVRARTAIQVKVEPGAAPT